MEQAGAGGHNEINRTNQTKEDIAAGLQRPVVQKQLELLRWRASCPAFSPEAEVTVASQGSRISFRWRYAGQEAALEADLSTCAFTIST